MRTPAAAVDEILYHQLTDKLIHYCLNAKKYSFQIYIIIQVAKKYSECLYNNDLIRYLYNYRKSNHVNIFVLRMFEMVIRYIADCRVSFTRHFCFYQTLHFSMESRHR